MKIKLLHPDATPTRGTPGSAAYDLRVFSGDFGYLAPGERAVFGTGLAVDTSVLTEGVDNGAVAGIIVPRSGLGSRGLVLANGTGVIDPDYRGEIKLTLMNTSGDGVRVQAGDRVAQLLLVPVILPDFEVVAEFEGATERGVGGFGSTGVA